MQKDSSFIGFIIFAFYCAAGVLVMAGAGSLMLTLLFLALCCVCTGRNAYLTAAISAVLATASIFLDGPFVLFAVAFAVAFCLAYAHSRSLGYTKSAFLLTVVFCAGIVFAFMLSAYRAVGAFDAHSVIQWISEGFEEAAGIYAGMLRETYGMSFEETVGISFEQIVSMTKTASINMLTGITVFFASVTALVVCAISFKVKYRKMSLLDIHSMSPVGGFVMIVSLALFTFAGGKTMIMAGNLYAALLPWFLLSGIRVLKKVFVRKRPVSVFTVITVTIISFSVGLTAGIAYLGATDDVIRGVTLNEKQKEI